MIAIFVATQLRLDGDPRPNGGAADFDRLSTRTDLNLLFVLVDTLRADHLGCYGYERPTSPHVDGLARTGVQFTNHLAQSSWTKTSMASLWTGLYPSRVGVLRASDVISPDARMPAEVLEEAGFETVALWRNGWVAPNFGFGQGFDAYISPRPAPAPAGFRRENPGIRVLGSDFDAVESFEEYLRTNSADRWFVYLHLMDVHQYATDEGSALFGTTYLDAYDNSIHFTDRAVRALLDLLERHELRERTVIVLASDHGEAFGEHGSEGHARDLHAEVTRTPWIMSLPFRLDGPVLVDAPSENVDIWPTLLAMLGQEGVAPVDGRSMLPEIRAAIAQEPPPSPRSEPRERIAHIDRHWARPEQEDLPVVAVTRGRLRFFHGDDRSQLFDIEADPGEHTAISEDHPEATARLRDALETYLATEPVWSDGVPQVELDEMQMGQLRALGYVLEGRPR
jgi:arylsulfatase A-like enzyme